MKKFTLIFLACISAVMGTAQNSVNTSVTAQQMADYILGSGVDLISASYAGHASAKAIFRTTQLPQMDSGICLSTGLIGNNLFNQPSTLLDNALGTASDPNLNNITGRTGFDAASLELVFKPRGNKISFQYIFASDEYPGFVCDIYNDIFALLIREDIPSSTNINIARIPNTNIPISINSLNGNTTPCSGYTQSYRQFYVATPSNASFALNGRTVVLTAEYDVVPCQTYRLRFAIQDDGDNFYNSMIFVKANSLNSTGVTIQHSANIINPTVGIPLFKGCEVDTIKMRRNVGFAGPIEIIAHKQGTAVEGVDYAVLPDTVNMTATQQLYNYVIRPLPSANPASTLKLKFYRNVFNCNNQVELLFLDSVLYTFDNLQVPAGLNDTVICKGSPLQLNVLNAAAFDSIRFLPNTGLNNNTIFNPVFSGAQPVKYQVSLYQRKCLVKDSIEITLHPVSQVSLNTSYCQQDLPFTWNGKTVNSVGNYTLADTTASTVTGCDSITTLALTVHPTQTRSLTQVICQQTLPFTWNGQTVTSVGNHTLTDTRASVITGCDSVTTLALTVHPTLTRSLTQVICQQTLPFTWNGQTVTSVGNHTLTDTRASVITGCDSTTTLALTVHPTLARSLTQVICQQTLPFTWNGQTVTSVGNHTLTDTRASVITGCDSVTTLALTVHPTLARSLTQVICQQTLPFTWNGQTVTSVGNHTLTDTRASVITGCDSITTLALTVHPTQTRSLTQAICQETLPFTWNGQTVTSVGNHTLTDTRASVITGCDSITTLQLRVYPSPVVRLGNDTAVCANVIYTINGTTPNAVSYLWNTSANTPAINVSLPGTYSLSVTDNNNCTGKDTIVVTHLAIPVVNLGPDVNDCVDAGWTHTLQAGNTGATFLWDDNSTGQSRTVTQNGRYIVWVTNASGCRTSDTVNVNKRLNPVVMLIPDTNICVADTIIIDGTTPDVASYSWSTGVTTPTVRAYQTGKYKLVVAGTNGCSGTDSTYVTVHEYPVVDLGSDINKCVDRGHLEFLNARSAGDDYLWDNDYNGQVRVIDGSGTYWVAVTNQWHCTTHDTININFKWNPEVQLGNDTNVCEGREVLLDAGGDGIYYQWNTGMTSRTTVVDNGGLYTVAVTGQNGCISTDSILITQNGKAPQYSGIWVRNVGTHTFKFELVDPAHISGYIWNFGDGSPLSYSETPVHTFPASGNYVVRLKVLNSCGDESDTTTIHIKPTGIDGTELLSDALRIYPLPVMEGKVTVEILEGAKIKEIVIVSTLGQELERHTVSSLSGYTLDVSQYSAAAYYLRVVTDKGVVNRKIVIGR